MRPSTGLQRDTRDQFYTAPDVAEQCLARLRVHAPAQVPWIEPSAGEGVFLSRVAGAIGYDIDPKHPAIRKADFLTVDLPPECVVFGNPPFGRQGSLAKKFIQHAARSACVIGFILPRSFVKPSMQKAFPASFHLVDEIALPDSSFLVNGQPYAVPCVFQVWVKRDTYRQAVPEVDPEGFSFVKKSEAYHLAFRRVGGTAGRCSLPSESLAVQCHYFIRLEDPTQAENVVAQSLSHTFPTNTTGPRSLSKAEATEFLNTAIANSAP
jgi:hypothetical protein